MLEEPVGIRVAKLVIEAHVHQVVLAAFVRDDSVDDEIPVAAKIDILDEKFGQVSGI